MTMTLQEMLPAIRQLSVAEKTELRHLLAEEVYALPTATTFESLRFMPGKSTLNPDDFPFSDGTIYEVYSPYECSGVEFLMQALREAETENPT